MDILKDTNVEEWITSMTNIKTTNGNIQVVGKNNNVESNGPLGIRDKIEVPKLPRPPDEKIISHAHTYTPRKMRKIYVTKITKKKHREVVREKSKALMN